LEALPNTVLATYREGLASKLAVVSDVSLLLAQVAFSYSSLQASCKTFQSIRIISEFFQNDVPGDVFVVFQMWPSSVNLDH
jgi:hypothetical protein